MTTLTPPRPAEDEWAELPWSDPADPSGGGGVPPERSRITRLVRGRPEDPAWARPALVVLLGLTAVLYLWDLGASGWANSFYSAAVQAGTRSWKAFFFGSSDASNFITVDKPPASLWVMEVSARIFGLSSWSILVPQALEGVAAVGILYATVRRWFGAGAGLLAGAIMALTPVAVLMFRYNNPDALLVLLLTAGAYGITRAIESGSRRWLIAAFVLVGFGFITKELQAFLVVPAFGVAYLLCAPPRFWRRVGDLAWAGLGLVVSSGWWVAAVQLTPAADRPYIGGSQDNNLLNLIFGYNGFGRLTGNETGSVGGGRPPAGGLGGAVVPPGATGTAAGASTGGFHWGLTGLSRLFGASMGSQVAWLLPAALILLATGLAVTLRARRVDRTRAGLVLWGLTLVVSGLTFSLGQGIIHPYYTVALTPAIGALVAIGASMLWSWRGQIWARLMLAGTVALTAFWSYALMRRSPTWHPGLRLAVLVVGAVAAVGLTLALRSRPSGVARTWPARLLVGGAIGAALVAVLGGPAAYALETAVTPHTGAIPSAGPAQTGANAFGSGGPAGRVGGRVGGGSFAAGINPGGFGPGGFGGPAFSGGPGGPAGANGTFPGGGRFGGGGFGGGGFGGGGFPGSRAGGGRGLLNASQPPAAVTKALQAGASHYKWVAAAIGSNSASGYQLASGDPVMAIGGFNGTDPAPTLAQFKTWVADGYIHYFIAGGGFGAGQNQNGDYASQIASWVETNFGSQTIGGVTLYNLTVNR